MFSHHFFVCVRCHVTSTALTSARSVANGRQCSGSALGFYSGDPRLKPRWITCYFIFPLYSSGHFIGRAKIAVFRRMGHAKGPCSTFWAAQTNLRVVWITLPGIPKPNITRARKAVSMKTALKDVGQPTALSSVPHITHHFNYVLTSVALLLAVARQRRSWVLAFSVTIGHRWHCAPSSSMPKRAHAVLASFACVSSARGVGVTKSMIHFEPDHSITGM